MDARRRLVVLGVLTLALTTLVATSVGSGAPGDTARVSIASGGGEGNGDSIDPSISANGNRVVFKSRASNLVAGDTNTFDDVFLRDRSAGTLTRMSIPVTGGEPNAHVIEPAVSADGSVVAFSTTASNMAPGIPAGISQIYVRAGGVTQLVSKANDGSPGTGNSFVPSLSADGRYVAFWSNANNLVGGADAPFTSDVFVFDRQTSTIELISQSTAGAPANAGQDSHLPSISADGRYVAFQSLSSTFSPADTNGQRDIYLRDRVGNTTTLISTSTSGALGDLESSTPAISQDGTTVAWESRATTLVPGDTNGDWDVFVRVLATSTTSRVSVSTAGVQAVGASGVASLSADGRYVAFQSAAPNLVAGDTNANVDVFVRDRQLAKTTRESLSSTGQQVIAASSGPQMSGDGRMVSFHSAAGDLVAGDTNSRYDVFVHELGVADVTPPAVTGAPDRAPNAQGWYNANVTIDWQSVDPTPSSGTPTDPPDTIASIEGQNHLYTSAQSCDPSNNCATGTLKLSIDKTAPAIAASLPTPNANGWYDRDILVAYTCGDALSGLASCTNPELLTTETNGTTRTGQATDNAGNTSSATTNTIRIDKTLPTITWTGDATYGIADLVEIDCTAADALSGIDVANCPAVSAPAYLFTPGSNAVSATASDKAGNTRSSTFTFTIQVTTADIGALACSFLGTTPGPKPKKEKGESKEQFEADHGTSKAREFCKKLQKQLQDVQAAIARNDSKKIATEVREFQKTVANESGKLLTPAQVARLSLLIASLSS